VVLYEDPARLTSANDLGPSRDWTLPVSKRQSTRCVVQVLEIATGRLVSGASVSLFSQNTDKLIGTHVTNGSGEAAFSLTLPERDRIEISAEYRATNGRRLEGFRSFPVADLGTSYVTTTGRTLTRSDGTYSGKTLELSRARKLPFSPGNLGTGVGTATKSIPAVQPGEAVRPTADGLIVGRHNVVALGGSNVLVASAPGMVLLGGDPVTAGAASARRAPGDPAIARAANLGGAMGGLLMSVTSTVKHAWDAGAGAVRTYVTEPISRKIAETVTTLGSMGVKPVASRLRPEKLGVVSASRGNVAPPKASVVSIRGIPIISTDGGTLISNDGGTLISTDGGTLISNDGGTLISTDGGTLIGQAGGNVISVGGGNVNLMPAYGGSGLIGQAGGNLISENGLG
jgi:hypothetical protein